MWMENYEVFYRRCVRGVNAEALCSGEPSHRGAQSAIHFHGRPVLQPKLSEEQRIEMAKQRQKAVEKESERRTLRTGSLLDRVQDILNRVQLKDVRAIVDAEAEQGAEASSLDLQALSTRRTHQEDQLPTGFIPSSSSSSSSALRRKTLRLLNSRMEKVGKRGEEWGEGEKTSTGTWPSRLGDIQRGSEDKAGVGDLESQCADRAEGQMESRNALHIIEADKENEICALECPLVVESGNHFTSIESSCSIETESPSSPVARLSLPPSLMGSYVQLPSLQRSCSPLTHCLRKPCLSSAGSILISLPISELELNKTNTVHCESHVLESASSGTTKSGENWRRSCSEQSGKKPFSVSSSASITPRRPVSLSHTPSPTLPGPAPHREKDGQSHSSPYRRTPPAPLNQSYDVESPSPSLLRPQVSSGPELFTEPVQHRLELEQCPQHPTEDSKTPGHLCDTRKRQDKAGDEVHQQIQGAEALHQRLEEDHAHQLSHQLKTQETDTQRLLQEIQRKHVVSSVSLGKPRSTQQLHMQMKVLSAEQHKAVCYMTAVGRGFLTRRLLKTEKIKHLRKTIQDSTELIRSFQTDTKQRRASFTPQDLSLQHRVRAQLRAALCNLHEIFFVWPVRNRLALLQQERELRNERRMREMEKAKSPQDRPGLSSATQKSLIRKKQRQGRKIPQKPKDPSARVLQPAQRQNAPSISQKLMAARVVRRTVENHRSHLSLG
ncbi:centriolar coiled-coil protein of 110 kDa [Pygocentrus nattereri]|uniref:centriolar coiled-coil protein of 110 kDa n=1 Tax=Pygocentrus nattereri TaxID=42514 RepID=UPI0008145B51|nr:centriolar coiled-coil protein of 110 kDa [Pygocentrus nattereri]